MTEDEIDAIFGVSTESPKTNANDAPSEQVSTAFDEVATSIPITQTCPTCGATFTKDTEKRAFAAVRLHHIRKHPDIELPPSLVGVVGGEPGLRLKGLTAAVHGTGNLPAGCQGIKSSVSQLRGMLEAAVNERHGTMTDPMRLLIQTALRWETYAELCRKWLNERYDLLNLDRKMELGSQIATASERRDKALERLGLHDWDRLTGDASTLYAMANHLDGLDDVEGTTETTPVEADDVPVL